MADVTVGAVYDIVNSPFIFVTPAVGDKVPPVFDRLTLAPLTGLPLESTLTFTLVD